MGCTSTHLVSDDKILQQENIKLNLDTNEQLEELSHAQSLINLISRIRNKIIYLYHQLIYHTGACLYFKPNIVHCLKTIFYKISSEFEGQLEQSSITYKEDPPYLQISDSVPLSKESKILLDELFNFIIELRSYKTIIKQIDKETPELLYLIFENKEKLSKENINKINRGINLFKDMIKIRYDILNSYKNQIYEYASRNNFYCHKINIIGDLAYQKKLTDIYEITMLKKENINGEENSDNSLMYKSISEAKKSMENIMKNEKNVEIIISHDSIIESQNDTDSKINTSDKK